MTQLIQRVSCLLLFGALQLACSSQTPPRAAPAHSAGSSAADGGTAPACVSAESCNRGESCLVYCEAGLARHGCHAPAQETVGYGEACSGKSCYEGICAAGAGKLSPARCMRFCDPALGCPAGDRCETRDVSYGCENGASRLRLSLCMPDT